MFVIAREKSFISNFCGEGEILVMYFGEGVGYLLHYGIDLYSIEILI